MIESHGDGCHFEMEQFVILLHQPVNPWTKFRREFMSIDHCRILETSWMVPKYNTSCLGDTREMMWNCDYVKKKNAWQSSWCQMSGIESVFKDTHHFKILKSCSSGAFSPVQWHLLLMASSSSRGGAVKVTHTVAEGEGPVSPWHLWFLCGVLWALSEQWLHAEFEELVLGTVLWFSLSAMLQEGWAKI